MFDKKAFWQIAVSEGLLALIVLLTTFILPTIGIWLCAIVGGLFGLAFICGMVTWCISEEWIFGISAGLALAEAAACAMIASLFVR